MTKLNHNVLKWEKNDENEARQLRESNLMPAKQSLPRLVGHDFR